MRKLDQNVSHRIFVNMPVCEDETKEDVNAILNQGSGWAGGRFCRLGENAIRHALYSWYVDHDLAAAKQWFYVAAKCIAISTTKPVGFAKLWTCHDFMFPLLSDNPAIIQQFTTLSPPGVDDKPSFAEKRENPKEGEFQSYLVQTAIQKDDEKLAKLIDLMKNKGGKKSQLDAEYIRFYSALIAGNVSEMEIALEYLGKFQSQIPTTEDFLAFHAVVLCKLAWLRGYEVQVDSPLVPMEFMPIAPLPHYDDVYEFLKPDWQTPSPPEPEKKGLLAKLFGK